MKRLLGMVERTGDAGVDELAGRIIDELCGDAADDCCVMILRRTA